MARVSVYVQVDMDEFRDEDLIEELEGRGYVVHKAADKALAAYEALKLNRPDALDLAKDFIAEAAGKVTV